PRTGRLMGRQDCRARRKLSITEPARLPPASERRMRVPADLRHNLLELPWVDVKRWLESTDVVLIPIGSCEKHGPHIPLGTDSYVTIEAVERAARLSKVPHAPLIPIGFSPHHMGEPGWGTGTI